ncbi:MAG: iron-sulfur cluster assembly accessory protein [Balneolaceae bacterium]
MADEKLDDVIASLIDDDGEEQATADIPDEPTDIPEGEESVNLTSRAARQVRKIREDEGLDEELYLRVAVEGGGCSGLNYRLGFDLKNEEDRLVESEGVQIVVNPRHLIYLNGIRIDYPDGLDARGFTFDNPNATENCGCGASFAI